MLIVFYGISVYCQDILRRYLVCPKLHRGCRGTPSRPCLCLQGAQNLMGEAATDPITQENWVCAQYSGIIKGDKSFQVRREELTLELDLKAKLHFTG